MVQLDSNSCMPCCNHFVLKFSLSFLLVVGWGVRLHKISSEYWIKSITKKNLVSKWFQCSEITAKILFQLKVLLSLTVFKSSYLLRFLDNSSIHLTVFLGNFFSFDFPQTFSYCSSFIWSLVDKIIQPFNILVENSLLFSFLNSLFFQLIHDVFVSLGLSFDIGPVNLFYLHNNLLLFFFISFFLLFVLIIFIRWVVGFLIISFLIFK